MNKPKVLLVHNEASPYRLPLFEELSREIDLTVYFCREKSSHREWNTSPEDYGFRTILGKGAGLGSVRSFFQLWRLVSREDFELLIVGELGLGLLPVWLGASLVSK